MTYGSVLSEVVPGRGTAAARAAPAGAEDDPRRTALRAVEAEIDQLSRRLRRVLQQRAASVGDGLSTAGYFVLNHLVAAGPVRQVDLVEALDSDKGAISRLVQHLVDAGLAERTPDPEDRRACRVAATDRALVELRRVDSERRDRYHDRLAEVSTEELDELARLLGRYNRAVED